MQERAIDAYIAAGRAKHPTDGEGESKRVAAIREKIRAGGLRQQLPEPMLALALVNKLYAHTEG
jgi:hypothetical protein